MVVMNCLPCRAKALSMGGVDMPVLRRNSKGPAVADLQRRLVGKLGSEWASLLSDGEGFFGARTEAAVVEFQKRERIKVDGVVGAQTWSALIGVVLTPPAPLPATDASNVPVPTEPMAPTRWPFYLALGAAGVLIVLGVVLRPKRAMAGYRRRKRR